MTDITERMKDYEQLETSARLMPRLPVCIRLDGKKFSKLTSTMNKPFDSRFAAAMQETTRLLVQEYQAKIGFTVSDEITLIFYTPNEQSEMLFNGKTHKFISIMASMATSIFQEQLRKVGLGDYVAKHPIFDARIWQVPSKEEATNVLLWRERDGTRNSISMAARSVFSHKEIDNKSGAEMQDMLMKKGINWNNYDTHFKRGSYFKLVVKMVKLDEVTLANIPAKHRPPDGTVARRVTEKCEVEPLDKLSISDRIALVFGLGDE